MHGRNENIMAKSSKHHGLPAQQQGLQSTDPIDSLAKSCPQHGPRLASSTGHTACSESTARGRETDMEGVCSSGGGHRRPKIQTHASEQVACLGQSTDDDVPAISSQGETKAARTPVTTSAVLGLLEKQGYRCALSGRTLTPDMAALDHIVPIRCGGEHVIENTQVLHKDVNRAKGSLTNAEFVGLCREVVRCTNTHSIEDREGAE